MRPLAAALGVFVAVRAVIAFSVRPHYVPPVARLFPLAGATSNGPTGSWLMSDITVGPGGHAFVKDVSLQGVPAACRSGFFNTKNSGLQCLSSHGFHQWATYQRAGRFWAFQGIEAAFFVLLAAALVALSYWRVSSCDA